MGLFFVYCSVNFEVALAGYGSGKKRGNRGLSPAQSARRTAGRSACPAQRQVFSAFYTTATGLYMSSFLFLTFCVYVFRCSGLYFSISLFQNFPPTAFFAAVQTSTEALHVSNRACLGLWWCRFPTWPPKPHTGANLLFLPRTGLPLPLKGEGLGIVFLDSLGFPRREARCFSAGKDGYFVSEGFSRQLPWQLLATTGSHGPNRAGL